MEICRVSVGVFFWRKSLSNSVFFLSVFGHFAYFNVQSLMLGSIKGSNFNSVAKVCPKNVVELGRFFRGMGYM